MVTGPHEAHRQDPHRPMQYDTGRPNSVIRLRISQSRTTSLPGPAGLRARRPSPMTDARLAPPARPPAPESAVACRSGGFQARLGPCVPWKPPDIDPIGHPHVVFRVDWTTPDDPARSRVIPRRTGYQHVWSASAEGAQPLGMEPRSGPARARVRPRRPALLSRVTRSLAGSYPVAWTRATAHRRAVSGSRRLEVASRCWVSRVLTRWCVARGGGVRRGAGRLCRPCGAADGMAPPAPAAPDRRRVGPRRRAVPARG